MYLEEILALCVHGLHPAWGGSRHALTSHDSLDDDESSSVDGDGGVGGLLRRAYPERLAGDGSRAEGNGVGWGGREMEWAACGLGQWSDEGRWHLCEVIRLCLRGEPLSRVLLVCEGGFLGAGAEDEHHEPLDSPSHRCGE